MTGRARFGKGHGSAPGTIRKILNLCAVSNSSAAVSRG